MLVMATSTVRSIWFSLPNRDYHERRLIHTYSKGVLVFKSKFNINREFSNLNPLLPSIKASAVLNRTLIEETVDCNENIRRLCEMDDLKGAMNLLSESDKSEIELGTYCTLLQLCAEQKSLKDGRKVHSLISSNNLSVDCVLGVKLVFMYVNCGDLVRGREIFNRIANEKAFLWNLLINEYAKIGNFKEGIFLFHRMRLMGVEVNAYTFSCVLKCFAGIGHAKEGVKLHGCLLKFGFDTNSTVMNSLIGFYFKCGRVRNAQKLFDEMGDRDVVSWNSMISGYSANGFAEKGIEFFLGMISMGIHPDLTTMVCVLETCATVGSLMMGRTLHGFATKASLNRNLMFDNTLLDLYSKSGDLDSAICVFKNMCRRSVVSMTSMVAAYVREGLSDDAISLFLEMKSEGIRPDSYAITSVLSACGASGSLQNGKVLHDYIRKNDLESDLSICNALMDMYGKCGSLIDAQSIFDQMSTKDTVSWNTMIGSYSKHCLPNEALHLFVEMQEKSISDSITMACILPACASLGALERGREVHAHVVRNGYLTYSSVANALIDMYVKCGAITPACLLFSMIPRKDLVSWTIMIAGYAIHGLGKEAISTFGDMKNAGIEPDEHAFMSILSACSHSGLVDEGRMFYDIMKNEYNIPPKMEHYACMVDLLARAGKLKEAYNYIETMQLKPEARIWGALLRGCRMHHEVKLAEKVAEHVFNLEPENTGHYILLADIYAESEKLELVKKLKGKVGRHLLKKNHGCSWIEVKGKVNIFTNGNTHAQSRKIRSSLKRLKMKMREDFYPMKMKHVLINTEKMGMDVANCGHTEQLAMTFGLLNLSPGRTIHVTKNSTICSECHDMAKFMSRSSGRDILVRDSNRFHRFRNGICSCRGCW